MLCWWLLSNKKVVAKSIGGYFRRISLIRLIRPIRPVLQVKSHERQGYEQRAASQCDEEVNQSGAFQPVMARQAEHRADGSHERKQCCRLHVLRLAEPRFGYGNQDDEHYYDQGLQPGEYVLLFHRRVFLVPPAAYETPYYGHEAYYGVESADVNVVQWPPVAREQGVCHARDAEHQQGY